MSDLIIDGRLIDEPIENILRTIRSELTNGKLRAYERNGDNYFVTCPHHKDGRENHPSCHVYCGSSKDVEYGTMYCFTCGERGPLYHFVGECFDADDEFGKRWLLSRFGNTLVDRPLELEAIELGETKKEFIDSSVLNSMQSWHPYMEKRKLSRAVCERFGVKYDPKTKSIVFPVWDEDDNLYMFTRRSVESKAFMIDSNKEKPVYLLNVVKRNGIKEVTVVESQMNCLTAWGWGIPSIALFGTGTSYQYDLLNKSQIRHYYLCFDGDDAGRKGIDRFLKNIRKDVFVDIILMKEGKDVNDLTESEFDALPIIGSDEWKTLYGKH